MTMTHECCDSGVRKSARDIIVRELVSNLLIHREFVSPFPAKLIIDAGGIRTENASRALYEGRITLSDFNPMPKNPTIADVFAHIGRAEELGSGMRNLDKFSRLYSGRVATLEDGDVFRASVPVAWSAAGSGRDEVSDSCHSIEAIWAENPGLFPVGARTFRSYVDKGVFGLANIELPRKVKYKPRRKSVAAAGGGPVDATGRTYGDFLELAEDVRRSAFQLDCVMGRVGDSQCVLSFHVPRIEFQIYLLLSVHVAAEVVRALDFVELACGGAFARLFPVGLTDRGGEFSDAEGIERSAADPSRKRCSIYYCDPMNFPSPTAACRTCSTSPTTPRRCATCRASSSRRA